MFTFLDYFTLTQIYTYFSVYNYCVYTHTKTYVYYIHRPRLSKLQKENWREFETTSIHYTYMYTICTRSKTRVTTNRLPCRRWARSFAGHKSPVFYHNERCAFLLLLLFFLFVTSIGDGGQIAVTMHETYSVHDNIVLTCRLIFAHTSIVVCIVKTLLFTQ